MGANASREGGADFLEFCEPRRTSKVVEDEEIFFQNEGDDSVDYVMPLEYLDYYWIPGRKQAVIERALGPGLDEDLVTKLFEHTRLDNASAVHHLLKDLASKKRTTYINCLGLDGMTMLHAAAEHGCIRVAKYLINQGADPETPSKDGKTFLQLCKHENFIREIQREIEKKRAIDDQLRNRVQQNHLDSAQLQERISRAAKGLPLHRANSADFALVKGTTLFRSSSAPKSNTRNYTSTRNTTNNASSLDVYEYFEHEGRENEFRE